MKQCGNVDLMPLDMILQILTAHFQDAGRLCDVSASFLQHFAQGAAFKAMDGGLERIVCRRCRQLHVDVCWQILRGDRGRGVGQDVHGMFDGVLQLPHIAGPVIGLEDFQCGGVNGAYRTRKFLVALHNKMLGQQQNIFFAVAQGRVH